MAAKRQTDTALYVENQRQVLRSLSKISKELQGEVRDASQAIAGDVAAGAKRSAAKDRQAAMAFGSVRARRDRVPVVVGGGVRHPGPVFFGAEFGGGRRPRTRQFRPHKGREGYHLYPWIRGHGDQITDEWLDAIDKAMRDGGAK